MKLKLVGGPLDGTLIDATSRKPALMLVADCENRPVYKKRQCSCCEKKAENLTYTFMGYEAQIARMPMTAQQSRLSS